MSLFKRSFENHIHNLANQRTESAEISLPKLDFEELLERANTISYHEGSLSILLLKAPAEIKLLLFSLLDEAKLKEFRKPYLRYRKGNRRFNRETTNEKFCRILGLDPENINILRLCHDYFTSSEEKVTAL